MNQDTVYISVRGERGSLTIDGDLGMLHRFLDTMRAGGLGHGSVDEELQRRSTHTGNADQRQVPAGADGGSHDQ